MGFPFEPRMAPSQLPVPSGFTPDWKPSAGARAAICDAEGVPLAAALFTAATTGDASGDEAAGDAAAGTLVGTGTWATTVAGFWPALRASCWRGNVVETTGQPLPGPFRFCKVTAAAFSRAF